MRSITITSPFLLGNLNSPDVCWKYNAVERKQFPECLEENFLTQLESKPAREGALPDLLFANREAVVGDTMIGGCLGHSNCEITEFSIFGEARGDSAELFPWTSGGQTSILRRLVEKLLGGIPKRERSPGKTDIFEEANPRIAEMGCPHVAKEELLGNMTSMTDQCSGLKSGKIGESMPSSSGGLQGYHEVIQGEN